MLDHLPVLQDHDFVGAMDGAQTVRDDDSGTVSQQLVHRALDQLFRRRVEALRGFIQNDDPRIAQKHARKRQQLRFPCR